MRTHADQDAPRRPPRGATPAPRRAPEQGKRSEPETMGTRGRRASRRNPRPRRRRRGQTAGMPTEPVYESIGAGYATQRRPDPRWEAAIHEALGDAGSVVNVGAGTG